VRAAGHNAVMVLLNARETINRTADANRLYQLLAGENQPQVVAGLR
jgi:hypothetical protein